ncbi:tRNA pseudouridine(55) synthase TruB [Candidatus Saccharibacteria bacterium]|nr:tRNA pseudouridine(55) synthase TruB [Candidatus Saccharibacteria bacterium]
MENQVILIDKPAGISSFGVVAKVRGKLKAEFGHKVKVGHTGTLDPFATGLLILLTGQMTRKSNEFLKLDKVYEATLKLGFVSTTGDPEGEIQLYSPRDSEDWIRQRSSRDLWGQLAPQETTEPREDGREGVCLRRTVVESCLKSFIGKINQTPPKFSAIKINGERAYKLARANKYFEIPSREVEIYSIEILEYDYPTLKIRCAVSSGTYIRTLAEDIGKKLGTGAYLTALRRTKIADYSVEDAYQLSDFTN